MPCSSTRLLQILSHCPSQDLYSHTLPCQLTQTHFRICGSDVYYIVLQILCEGDAINTRETIVAHIRYTEGSGSKSCEKRDEKVPGLVLTAVGPRSEKHKKHSQERSTRISQKFYAHESHGPYSWSNF